MSFSEILNLLKDSFLNELNKKGKLASEISEIRDEIKKLKSKSTVELQKIANGWEPEARRRAAQIILNHRNQ